VTDAIPAIQALAARFDETDPVLQMWLIDDRRIGDFLGYWYGGLRTQNTAQTLSVREQDALAA